MKEIQLHRIDLNLLVVFEALMVEGSVAGAAVKLNKTPSAVSHALARLRDQVGDPLLVKVGGRMQASPFCASTDRRCPANPQQHQAGSQVARALQAGLKRTYISRGVPHCGESAVRCREQHSGECTECIDRMAIHAERGLCGGV